MQIEALIIRRCYPMPVTFVDLRAAYAVAFGDARSVRPEMLRAVHRRDLRPVAAKAADSVLATIADEWTAALKDVTSALDEVYAVVDGREVRVTTVSGPGVEMHERRVPGVTGAIVWDFLDHVEREGYWRRPHEVRVDFETTRPTHDEVARAVAVGQMALERGGMVRL